MEWGIDRNFEMSSLGWVPFVDLGESKHDLCASQHAGGGWNRKGITYLDPVVDLDVLVCGVKMQALRFVFSLHFVAAWQLHIEFHLRRANTRVI